MNEISPQYIKNRSYILISPNIFKANSIIADVLKDENNNESTEYNEKELQSLPPEQLELDYSNKTKFISLLYRSPTIHLEGITFETPWMSIIKPIFQNTTISNPLDKSFIELNFIGIENDSKLQQFLQCMIDIDKWMVNTFSNIETYSNITSASTQTTKPRKNKRKTKGTAIPNTLYMTSIKQSVNPENPNQLYYHMKGKIHIIKKHIEYNNKIIRNYKHFFSNVNISNSICKAVIHCSGIWHYEGRYGLTWNILALNIHSGNHLDYYDTDVSIEDTDETEYHIPNFESEVDPDMMLDETNILE